MRRLRGMAAALGVLSLASCGMDQSAPAMEEAAILTGGDPYAGAEAIDRYGCDACHTIPGIPGANGKVGPPLAGLGERMYIAGVLSNQPDNLVRWIMDPPAVDPRTAMPNLGVTEADARDIAAYLYSLP